jgi:RHH-type proline utilization regulon transcriptional repressor/proline dehydrogenase/delta 1-pyrroline-5-carboxylate dehydrogenase
MDDKTNHSKKDTKNLLEAIFKDLILDAVAGVETEAQKAAFLAAHLLNRATQLETVEERRKQDSLAQLTRSPSDKAMIMKLTDQSFRSSNPRRVANQIVHLLKTRDIPGFMGKLDRSLLEIFRTFGNFLPELSVPIVKMKMRSTSDNMILAAEPEPLKRHLEKRQSQNLRMNVNFLGEAVLGEAEATRRYNQYMKALANSEVEVVSIKISTIYSQISPVSAEHTIGTLCDRLEKMYLEAARHEFVRHDGEHVPKFVYLDMEEYRDMYLTAEAFMRTLDRPSMKNVFAGIVLQAYIPDSFLTQQRLNEWARKRVAAGGSPITIRIVKGANLEVEKTESSIKDWAVPQYGTKIESDANYKRMLLEGLKPENIAAVRLGVASHNLFDLSLGIVLASERGAMEQVQLEMLEGMADHICRAISELTERILLYAPATRREDFISAIGYLTRRLDENTGPGNFLSHSFDLAVGDEKWLKLERDFYDSWKMSATVSAEPRRKQDRNADIDEAAARARLANGFVNEPDTDFSLPANQRWAERIVNKWQPLCDENAIDIPLVLAGEDVFDGRRKAESTDPSRPGVVVAHFRMATSEDVDAAVRAAKADDDGWRSLPVKERSRILANAAMELRKARADLMGAALAEGGKTLPESDPEVSEAVDFAEYYALTSEMFCERNNLECSGKGVVVVVSPWNFPIAIPCGGVAAGLAAGNTVILKPASDTALVAYEMCKCFWRAGVSKKTLQFLPCAGGSEGAKLASHPDVDAVILTGGTDTALRMLKKKPDMTLYAETGGKNATIVTAMSDRDQAIKNVIQSAFGHSGQKCSATSLLILEEEVFEDELFRRQLVDAVKSLKVGSAWRLETKVGPMIKPPSGDLKKALTTLEPGEEWAVEPKMIDGNPRLWSPAVKWNVAPGSHSHLTELFGPVLSVMKADSLAEAVSLIHMTGYGLTSGIESLDERECEYWKEHVVAGNLYINRGTTGAIVLRQPFGGMGKSAFGPGVKAGGPNYVALLMKFKETDLPDGSEYLADPQLEKYVASALEMGKQNRIPMWEAEKIIASARSCHLAAIEEFYQTRDHFKLRGQDNFRRYLPVEKTLIRIHPDDSYFDIAARICAARIAGCSAIVSMPEGIAPEMAAAAEDLASALGGKITFSEDSDGDVARMIFDGAIDRIRYAAPERAPILILSAAAETGLCVAREPVTMDGRVELIWHMREQSISSNYHRYGNLGDRQIEE